MQQASFRTTALKCRIHRRVSYPSCLRSPSRSAICASALWQRQLAWVLAASVFLLSLRCYDGTNVLGTRNSCSRRTFSMVTPGHSGAYGLTSRALRVLCMSTGWPLQMVPSHCYLVSRTRWARLPRGVACRAADDAQATLVWRALTHPLTTPLSCH